MKQPETVLDPPLRAPRIIILGAGPAGLACAYELSRHSMPSRVVDRNRHVGGLLRTMERDGYRFDIGGHRFLSCSEEVNRLWRDMLQDDLLRVRRRSRILYKGKFFDYPLKAANALRGLGFWETFRCIASYCRAKLWPPLDETNIENWMIKRFGRRLFEIFFKSYTEKVWGISCSNISSDWAAQRIQDMSLWGAIKKSLFPSRHKPLKTLTQEFVYPTLGPGLFCERIRETTEPCGTEYLMETEVVAVHHDGERLTHITVKNAAGEIQNLPGDTFFSSIPITQFTEKLTPAPPREVSNAARSLKFRNFLVVLLILDIKDLFPDNWIYIQSSDIKAGRIQNYKNWSPHMVPDPSKTTLGVEYFLNESDDLWRLEDHEIIHFALHELEKMGFEGIHGKFIKGFAVHTANAYPVYDAEYKASLNVTRSYLERFSNFQTLGRAGLFRYNNSDHALLTGIYGARNILGADYNLWEIDPDNPARTVNPQPRKEQPASYASVI